MPLTEKQKKDKRERYKNATEAQKSNYAKYQKENYKNIAASFKRSEAEYIAAIFEQNGVTPAQVIRGAAAALIDGEPIRTEREPLTIPEAEAGQGESEPAGEASEAGEPSPSEE